MNNKTVINKAIGEFKWNKIEIALAFEDDPDAGVALISKILTDIYEGQYKPKMEPLNNSANIMLYAMKGDSMLDVARKVVDAVEFSVEEPSGYHLLAFDKNRETKSRIKELIEYLKVYTNWRD